MRKIKFRLRIGNKIVGYEWWGHSDWYYRQNNAEWSRDYIPHADKDQFTGLHDKNGKEIYEGDILRYNYEPDQPKSEDFLGEVIYDIRELRLSELDSLHVGFILRGIDIDGSHWYTDLPNLKDVEVIGNIYENPELLTEKPKEEP